MKQAHIFFTGMVQGVGFRYTTQNFAHNLQINGWVRNLDDGRVEVIAQGSEKLIKELCQSLKGHFGAYIREINESWEEGSQEFSNFQVYH